MPNPWWLWGAFALCLVSLGLAVLVDPANFAPTLTDPRALMRRRIFGGIGFLLMACLMGLLAFFELTVVPSSSPERGWFASLQGLMNLFGGCNLILFAIPAIHVWFQIASRARGHRRTSRPHSRPG
jgi:hypothetical protein